MDELTPRTGRVVFHLEAIPEELESLVAGLGAGFAQNEHGFEISLDQDEQDQLVDCLRAANVSIRSIMQRKLTLEESFIDVVQKGAS